MATLRAGALQAVATAVKLSAHSAAFADTAALSSDVEHLEDELASLRSALDEVSPFGA